MCILTRTPTRVRSSRAHVELYKSILSPPRPTPRARRPPRPLRCPCNPVWPVSGVWISSSSPLCALPVWVWMWRSEVCSRADVSSSPPDLGSSSADPRSRIRSELTSRSCYTLEIRYVSPTSPHTITWAYAYVWCCTEDVMCIITLPRHLVRSTCDPGMVCSYSVRTSTPW